MPPALLVVGGVVVLHGPALPALRDALLVSARTRQRNGLPVGAHHAALLAAITEAMAVNGQSDGRESLPRQADSHDELPTVPLAEAARRLGRSRRQTRRLAPRLGGRRIAGRWLLDDLAIREHLEGRTDGP
jgi:hypothetical protein